MNSGVRMTNVLLACAGGRTLAIKSGRAARHVSRADCLREP
jgi:hypothetical protein